MEPEGSQEPSTGPYPQPDQPRPYHSILFLWDADTTLNIRSCFFLKGKSNYAMKAYGGVNI
jgi:hypothetical protein